MHQEHISIPSSRSIRSHLVKSKKAFLRGSASVNSSRCDLIFFFFPHIYFSRGVKVNLTNHGCPRRAGIFAEARQRMWMTDRCFSQLLQMSDSPPPAKKGRPASKTFLDQSDSQTGSAADGACQHGDAPPSKEEVMELFRGNRGVRQ